MANGTLCQPGSDPNKPVCNKDTVDRNCPVYSPCPAVAYPEGCKPVPSKYQLMGSSGPCCLVQSCNFQMANGTLCEAGSGPKPVCNEATVDTKGLCPAYAP